MGDEPDQQLVLEIQEGKILAFEVLVRRYQGRVINFVNRIVFDRETAQEITQDTFLKTYQNISRINPERKFSTFLFEVAKNTAIDYLRRFKKESHLPEDFAISETSSAEDKIAVRAAVGKLPSTYRKVVGLYYFSGLSYEEISKKLRMPLNTVRTNLRRAKDKLRKML